MNETEFQEIADQTIADIQDAIDNCGADIDYDEVGGVLTLEFENGSKIIINYQSANGQLWLAARSGGFHYDYDEESDCWKNDRSGADLFDELSSLATEQADEEIVLKLS